ncbi:MAG: hypothetical protein H6581_15175 [Bacteroidia bacterium]|nr:hypothetical protein [Bacteroidia bacterium]
MKKAALMFLGILMGAATFAQPAGTRIPPRKDDHFQRNRVVSRVDLENKLNRPLIDATTPDLYAATGFEHNQGIIAALIGGMKAGKYVGYDPTDLEKSLTWEDLVARSQDINGGTSGEDPWESDPMEENLYDPEDPEGDLNPENDPFTDTFGSVTSGEEVDLAPLESVLEIIEDRILDKNRSEQIYDLQYLRLVWVDPGETLPDQHFVCFKYEDVMEVLENARWANKFNDAEDKNLREIFELRLFESYAINVSGRGVRSLPEAAFREQQLLEFEHNLWSY